MEVISGGDDNNGWKVNFEDVQTYCFNRSGEQLIKCVEDFTYSEKEIIISIDNKINHSKPLTIIKPFVSNYWDAIAHSLRLEEGMMSSASGRTVTISFNPNLSYRIRVIDPKLEFISTNPSTIPRSKVKLEQRAGIKVMFLKVID